MQGNSREKVEQFWRRELGLDSGSSPVRAGVRCTVQHVHSGLQLFRRNDELVLAAPPARAEAIQNAIQDCSADELFSVEWLQRSFGGEAERILGPAEVNYADSTSFRSGSDRSARPLSPEDAAARRAFVAALAPEEREESGVSGEAFSAFGVFAGDMLCAMASYEVWEPAIAHIRVATHPDHRRRGWARTVIQALAADAFDHGLVLQWRAVSWNRRSLTLARSLGFQHYCSTIFVRFHD